ncbi:MAG: PaaI family thioesterase [Mycolicibacterium hassiacum]
MAEGNLRYGEQPLPQTVAAAEAIRRLPGLLLSLEHEHPEVDAMLAQIAEWERELAPLAPPDPTPRIGPSSTDDQRVYLDHAFDIGAYNPCFPEYTFDHLDEETASGRVSFPVVFEGPPGLVNGGFLAVFFDCVTQHQSCAIGRTGRTRSLTVTFRRPTPILTELEFDVTRTESDGRVTSTARLLKDGEVLCVGEFHTSASSPEKLSVFEFGRRRPERP